MSGRRSSSFLLLLLSTSLGSIACSDPDDGSRPGPYTVGSDAAAPLGGGTAQDASTSVNPITGGNSDAGVVTPVVDSGAGGNAGGGGLSGLDAGAGQVDAGGSPASDAGGSRADASMQSDGGGTTTEHGACLDGITNYGSEGPFKYTTKTAGMVKLWVPTVPPGCKVPIVHLANGTTANCGNYQGALERLASHGFLTACYEDPNTGAGTYGVTAFETALSMFPDLADNKLGSTGHSQGGQASLVTLQLAEAKWGDKMIYAGLAMEPASGYGTQPMGQTWKQSYAKIKSPVFMFSGNSGTGFQNSSLTPGFVTGGGDGLVAITWVQEGFDALSKSIEAYHWLADGATHIPTPVGEEQQVSIPWFRWKLLGDKAACEYFKKMPMGGKWKVQKEQNAKPCE